jgi:hypothetical protein
MAKGFSLLQNNAHCLRDKSCTTPNAYRFFPRVNRPGGDPDRHLLSTAEIKGVELSLHSPLHVFMALACTNLHLLSTLFHGTAGKNGIIIPDMHL